MIYLTILAAIDVGSNELSLKIFEITKNKGIHQLDHVRHTIELGLETYTKGGISAPMANELYHILTKFTKKMKEYKVEAYSAYATSALREANNYTVILEQIKLRCGLDVSILSNSEQRFLCYKAITLKEKKFHNLISKDTLVVDIGSGSIQISLFNQNALISTQNIKIGSLRTKAALSDLEHQTDNFCELISEYLENSLDRYQNIFLQTIKIKHLIAVGEQLNELLHHIHFPVDTEYLNKIDFQSLYDYWTSKSIDTISKELNIGKEQAFLIYPTITIYHKIFQMTDADCMWLPKSTLCDGIAVEYAEKKGIYKTHYNFTEDILITARNIAKRYHSNTKHSANVEYIALSIFDSIRKYHGLGKREHLLLQIAVILHDIGEYINMNEANENSYKIIMSTEIIGLSHSERELIANIVRYSDSNFADLSELSGKLSQTSFLTLIKLLAILKIANAMDISYKQKFSNLKISIKENLLWITTTTVENITLERGLFLSKAQFFEDVYGLKPVLRQKRGL